MRVQLGVTINTGGGGDISWSDTVVKSEVQLGGNYKYWGGGVGVTSPGQIQRLGVRSSTGGSL